MKNDVLIANQNEVSLQIPALTSEAHLLSSRRRRSKGSYPLVQQIFKCQSLIIILQGAGLFDGGARGRGDGDEARQPETGDGGQGHDRQVSWYNTVFVG